MLLAPVAVIELCGCNVQCYMDDGECGLKLAYNYIRIRWDLAIGAV